jgi:glycine dehydrogenase subunit 1
MSLLGAQGLENTAATCIANTRSLVAKLTEIDGVESVFDGTTFHETVLRLPADAGAVLNILAERGVFGGLALADFYDGLDNTVLVCVTETKTEADLDTYAQALRAVLAEQAEAA